MSNVEQDISGLELVYSSKNSSGGTGEFKNIAGESVVLKEDEWYPAVLTKIVQGQVDTFGKQQLFWTYELQGDSFKCKKKDETFFQLAARGRTSLATGPKSIMYKVYTKLIGRELTEGEPIKLLALIGMKVEVMVKISKKEDNEGNTKTWYYMERVKPVGPVPGFNQEKAPVPAAPPVANETNKVAVPSTPVKPPEVVAPPKPVAPAPTAVKPELPSKPIKDIFADID